MMNEDLFDELKRYVDFTEVDERRLRALYPVVQPHIHDIIDDFYDHILNHPGASAAITGGQAQVERLKGTLRAWMDKLFTGPWDNEYFEQRARIGRRHVQIQLPQQYMFTAMDVIRVRVSEVVLKERSELEQARQDLAAVNRIMDMELAIHLHTYREDYLHAAKRNERLATFGQLVASIGHELRNPLGVMESSLYLLRRMMPAEEKVSRHLDKIEGQIKLSNRIITDLLDMVRDRPVVRKDVEVKPLVAAALEALPKGTPTRITTEIPDAVRQIHVDGGQVQQVLVNLISNGLEAAGADGELRISTRDDGDMVVLQVSDSGPGVDPAIRARLFEPLVSTKVRGVGLGLALCRKMAERNGGRVDLVSQGPLKGATFEVRLPAAGGTRG